jgi:sulfatase maturation enzyme AslB (radical SAM superfamily)
MASQNGSPVATISGPVPRITSLLVKPASAVCNLDSEYCFYLDRATDPYQGRKRIMSPATLERLVSGYLAYSFPISAFSFQGGEPTLAGLDFCGAYKRIFARAVPALGDEIRRLLEERAPGGDIRS